MEIEENPPRRQTPIRRNLFSRRYFNIVVPVLIMILLVTYLILSLLPGKNVVDPEISTRLLKVALALAPVKEEWNQTSF